MNVMASHITGISILINRLFRRRSKKTSASPFCVWRIHRWPVNSPHKGPVTRKMLPFDGVIMTFSVIWSTEMAQAISNICLESRLLHSKWKLNCKWNYLFHLFFVEMGGNLNPSTTDPLHRRVPAYILFLSILNFSRFLRSLMILKLLIQQRQCYSKCLICISTSKVSKFNTVPTPNHLGIWIM